MQKLITITELCNLLNRKRNRVYVMEKRGILPPAVKVNGRTMGWLQKDIEEFFANAKK
ncbi:helix-turn-helix domain-containing protein [Escherichia sp. M623]|uniref:helix-turn-helix transcriptional regulator n=1 Tax=Enterobacteriaceae TaxID=543 RepID=UPI00090792F4|nr:MULTISPECIES: helix-turn-helix domain-containing protein [Enterobacteriaceae]EBY3274944.1 helix-turn-helix domain-containing protein [Salmonella enterica subsp. enterica serovar Ohio]ECM9327020.1 helix-turn-helix domain-containing protein [Salmonella enterica subsp. enterica serovar Infantis]EJK4575274.1 helix-turn-helix domain-containing protein [Salmonella enterica]EDM3701136.1 AlpA family phage regulatory protein [Salmonella enterica subsp. enterica serovar Infantis]EHP8805199.1 helix-tu